MGFKFVQPWDLGSSIEGASGFSISAFMSAQADGYWFDFTKTDRFFQEATGPTLADDVGEALGLALDSRSWSGNTLAQQLAAQPELIEPDAFSPGAVWTASAGSLLRNNGIVSGVLEAEVLATYTGNARVYRSYTVEANTTYRAFGAVTATTVGAVPVGIEATTVGGATLSSDLSVGNGNRQTYFNTGANTTVRVGLAVNGTAETVGDKATLAGLTLRKVPGKHATQSNASLKVVRQTAGFKGDGIDDNQLTPYLAGVGANFLYAKTTVPVTLAAVQAIHGASGASANRVFLGVNTSGQACAGVGSDSTTTIVGTTDLRGTEADIALTFDGATVRLIVNGVVEYEAAQNSTPTTAIPLRLWALNDNGTGGSYYAGYCKHLLAGREFLTVSRFNQIKAALSA